MKTIDDRVVKLLVEQLGRNADDIARQHKLDDDLGVDSLDFVEIVMACEEEFEIAITDEEANPVESTGTVGDLIDLVRKKVAA